jgi:acetoin utilization deacetylase AcuC-like enzyme
MKSHETKRELGAARTAMQPETPKPDNHEGEEKAQRRISTSGLHYNIQIHLPATKDAEVYNAIFKSLKEHLIDE